MKQPPRSCYVLELSVEPGGSRWGELHAYTDPRHLQKLVAKFCKNEHGFPAYHAIWYGARLGVWVVQRGVASGFVDLHPHITARLGRGEPVTLTDRRGVRKLIGPVADGHDEDLPGRIKLAVAWDDVAAQLPALRQPRLAPGERTPVRHASRRPRSAYLGITGHVQFGSEDAEDGERFAPPFKIRGWDPLAVLDDDDDDDDDDE